MKETSALNKFSKCGINVCMKNGPLVVKRSNQPDPWRQGNFSKA